MDDQASRIEKTMKPVTEHELRNLGGIPDDTGLWTFPDRSQGRFTERLIATYSDEQQTRLLGFTYFEKIERVQ
jgi:hypothetical protein